MTIRAFSNIFPYKGGYLKSNGEVVPIEPDNKLPKSPTLSEDLKTIYIWIKSKFSK